MAKSQIVTLDQQNVRAEDPDCGSATVDDQRAADGHRRLKQLLGFDLVKGDTSVAMVSADGEGIQFGSQAGRGIAIPWSLALCRDGEIVTWLRDEAV
jgi:hypothetical protein